MAKNKAFPNIIDPQWLLSEETGRLTYTRLRYVSSNPRQMVRVECTSDVVASEFADRYRRLLLNRKAKGIRDD